GSRRATHSPQPSASGVVALTSRTSRHVWVPNDVRKGETSGRRIRRSSTSVIFMVVDVRARGRSAVRRHRPRARTALVDTNQEGSRRATGAPEERDGEEG